MTDVSVIVPALNEEKNIAKCLRSIRKQKTCLDYEIIVSDSHSSDKTREIAEKYADKVVNSRRKIYLGRNMGARHAKGSVFVFIDADTTIPKNYISTVHSVITGDNSIIGLSCAFKFDKRTRLMKAIEEISNYFLMVNGFSGKGGLLGFNSVFTKKIFKKLKGFPNSPVEDKAMGTRAKKLGRVVFLPEPKVTTSSRRFETMGTFRSILYYTGLSLTTHIQQERIRKLLKYTMFKYKREGI